MKSKTVAEKMGIKAGSRIFLLNAPPEAITAIEMPETNLVKNLEGKFDLIHVFVKSSDDMNAVFPELKKHLEINGMLWVSWPKAGQLGTDLALPRVISIGYSHGLVESTCLSVDKTWSALKFTHPKKGKTYNNSHAKLQSRTTNRG